LEANRKKHVVFGAGPLGIAVAEALLAKGYAVNVVTRSGQANVPAGAESLQGDGSDSARTIEFCEGAEAVYNCVGLPYSEWSRLLPIMEGIIAGAAAAGSKLVYPDNLYAYGPQNDVLHEDMPYRPLGQKDRIRAAIADMVIDAHRQGKVRAVIGRGPTFYGPNVRNSAIGSRVFENALNGKAARLIGNMDAPHTFIYIRDFATGIVELAEREEAFGQIWHLPCAETLTTGEFVDMVYRELGIKSKKSVLSGKAVRVLGLFIPLLRELKEQLYMFESPYVVDHGKFERAFGARTTPHEQAIKETIDWYRKSGAVH